MTTTEALALRCEQLAAWHKPGGETPPHVKPNVWQTATAAAAELRRLAALEAAQANEPTSTWSQYVAGIVVAYLGGGVDDPRIGPIAGIIERRLYLAPPRPDPLVIPPEAARLVQQVRTLCEATRRAGPGVAVEIPAELAEEGRKFMRGEPSLIVQMPFADVSSLGELLADNPQHS